MDTVGDRIDTLTTKYRAFYDKLREHHAHEKAANLAVADIYLQVFIWEEVQKNVESYIGERGQ